MTTLAIDGLPLPIPPLAAGGEDIPFGTILFIIAAVVALISKAAEKRKKEAQEREREQRGETPRPPAPAPTPAPAPDPWHAPPAPPRPTQSPARARPASGTVSPSGTSSYFETALPSAERSQVLAKTKIAKAAPAAAPSRAAEPVGRALLFGAPRSNRDRVRAALLWTEVLGRPKSAQRPRGGSRSRAAGQ